MLSLIFIVLAHKQHSANRQVARTYSSDFEPNNSTLLLLLDTVCLLRSSKYQFYSL